ncbi:MAG: hypothetical protein M0C28_34560 [Candidatus Moduliflexus flocculans]|nr:hypothetical protein [Candidatus Moduliflexus flocculans]
MRRKEIGNGAPNDGFGLTEVYGWALGTITTPAPQIYYVDNAMVYGVAPIRPLTVGFTAIEYKFTEGVTATLTAKLSKKSSDPVTVQYAHQFRFRHPEPRLHSGQRHPDLPAQHHAAILHHPDHR